LQLNRACTVVKAFWGMQHMPAEFVPDEVRQLQAYTDRRYIEQQMAEREREI
jgi:hypothetical protein